MFNVDITHHKVVVAFFESMYFRSKSFTCIIIVISGGGGQQGQKNWFHRLDKLHGVLLKTTKHTLYHINKMKPCLLQCSG